MFVSVLFFLLFTISMVFLSTNGQGNQQFANLVTLNSYVEPFGARSIDGSPYEIWVYQSETGSNKWAIDIQGGVCFFFFCFVLLH